MAMDITERLEGYSAAWANLTTDGIADFWWADNFRFYKAEEVRDVLTEWPSVLAYWRANEGMHGEAVMDYSAILDLDIPGPARLISLKLDWKIVFRDDARDAEGRIFRHAGRSMAGWNHVLCLWEMFRDEWHLTGWTEAPDAAVLYMTDLYYKAGES